MVAHQASLSMEFSRQEYWSGLLFPILGDLPNPGIKPVSLMFLILAGRFITTAPPGKPGKAEEWKIMLVTGYMWWWEFVEVLIVLIFSLK